jgi:hypothetical protein
MSPKIPQAAAREPKFIDVRVRFHPDELRQIKAAAANRGLGFNTFVRLVCAGTAVRVLSEAPAEGLVGKYLDLNCVLNRGRQPEETALSEIA